MLPLVVTDAKAREEQPLWRKRRVMMLWGPHRDRGAQRGMTLIEILSTLALMGIVTAVAATNLKGMIPSFRVRAAALMVAGDIAQARLSAVKTQTRYYFVPLAGARYQIQRDNAGQPGGLETLKDVTVPVEYPGIAFAATGLDAGPYGGLISSPVPGTIIFNADGTATNPGALFLEPDGEYQGRQHAVTVTGAGRVRVWQNASGSWR